MEQKPNKDKYPGYPHYPAKDDITQPGNNNGKVSTGNSDKPKPPYNDTVDARDESGIISDENVSKEDLRMLDAAEQNMDTPDSRNLMASALDNTDNDGDPLNEENSIANDMTGEDLDVPGSSADDANENIGEEDEENNYYSLGGDLHESQEENKGE